MKVSVILAHPKRGSFNHAIANIAARTLRGNNHNVIFHDLYEEKFEPCLLPKELAKDAKLVGEVRKHCEEIKNADGIIVVHPNWWGQPPAILKGWVDRVIRQGVAYEFGQNDKGEGVPIGLLKARTALVLTTSNTPEEREREAFGDPLQTLWTKCIFEFCGVKNVVRKNFGVVIISSLEERKMWLKNVQDLAREYFPAS